MAADLPGAHLTAAIRRLAGGSSLTAHESTAAFGAVMRGEGTSAQIAALLMGLRVKGETAEELSGAARAMREAMTQLVTENPGVLVDTCGTGGGTVTTFNISTAAALLAAGAGVRVAKHGNRSFSSRSGSADVLEALGVSIEVPVDRMRAILDSAGIVFMFAPTMHPAMRHAGPVRRELTIQTLMNLIGPLANPANATRQVIGVADVARLDLIAGALNALGTTHSLVVHGAPGIDEISPVGPTIVLELRDGATKRWTLDPADYGVKPGSLEDLAGGAPEDNARIIEAVLQGESGDAATAAVLLNAAGAIYVAGLAGHFGSALDVAREALRSGAGMAALQRLRAAAPR